MTPQHLMSRIEETYKTDLERVARRYAPKGTEWQDMYQDVLMAVYDRVRRRKVSLRNDRAMRCTIIQRAIDKSRKALLHRKRFLPEDEQLQTARYSDAPIPERMRVAELKSRLRSHLPILDARIVIAVVFPTEKAETLVRKRLVRKGAKRRQAQKWTPPHIWQVARSFNVSKARISEAMDKARAVIGNVLEEGDHVKDSRTICQVCNRKRECRLVRCDTRHLHPKGHKLTGKRGSSLLSVCPECAEKRGKGGG